MSHSNLVWVTAIGVALVATAATTRSVRAQTAGVVRGTVTDSTTRQPISRAQVSVVGTTRRGLTAENGRYELRDVSPGDITIRVQVLGYAPQERRLTLADSAGADFALARVVVQLSEVTVWGYGTERAAERSNAVATVSGEVIRNAPVAGIDGAIQGRAPGVQVIQNAGNPGNGITIRIRGAASLSAGNQPLYVVDGVPLLSDEFTQMGVGGQNLTSVTGLNPDDVESIDVLKDASAAAIYGSRASNGVVLITTKRGLAGASRVSFSSYAGRQVRERKVGVLNATEYIEYFNLGRQLDGYSTPFFTPGVDDTINSDWQDAVFRAAPVGDYNLNAQGGNERLRYYLSGSWFDQGGIVLGSGYDRASGRVNVDFNATERLMLRSSIYLTRERHIRNVNDNTIAGVVTNAIANQPNLPIRLDERTYSSTDDGLEYVNPVAIGALNRNEARVFRALGNVEAGLNITERLALNSRVGFDVLNNRDLTWESPQIIGSYAGSVSGVAEMGNNTAQRSLAEAYLTYDHALGAGNRVGLVGGGSVEYNSNELDWLRGEGFANEQFRYPGNAGRITTYDGDREAYNILSVFSRASATIADRYLFTASLRRDGSSRFGENNRYGVFPAGSFGWFITKEPFAAGLARHADVKWRVSYGVTGNQGIDNFAPLGRYGKANYGDEPGLGRRSIPSPDLKWESTREFDTGIDAYLFAGRLGITADWYVKRTHDLLVNRPITSTSGLTNFWDNIGNIENRGWELALTTTNLQPASADGFRWTSAFNISHNKNKVTKLFGDEPYNTGIRGANRVEVGQPIGAFHLIKFLGVDPETGNAIFDDLNNDGVINSDDRQIVGSPHPDYWGGLSNSFSWRGFDLVTFFQFSRGNEVFNAMRIFSDDGGWFFDNKFRNVLEGWKEPGDITDVPRASWDGVSGAREVSSRFVEDGSYVRLQEVTLGYRVPARVARAAKLAEARIFVSGRNLRTWTDYSGYNPDVNSNGSGAITSLGTDFYAYPLARTWMVGVSGAW